IRALVLRLVLELLPGGAVLLLVLVLLVEVRRVHAVAVLLRLALYGRDQLREHPRERVDLVPAKLGAGAQLRRAIGEHPLEPEHQPELDLPLGGRLRAALVELGDRGVEGDPPRRSGRERSGWILVRVQEGLARPRFRAR